MDEILLEFGERLGLLIAGVIITAIATTIMTMNIENGQYKKFSKRRINGLILFGGLSGLVAGLIVLELEKTTPPVNLVWKIILAQILAGIGGGETWKKLDTFLKPNSPTTSQGGAESKSEE